MKISRLSFVFPGSNQTPDRPIKVQILAWPHKDRRLQVGLLRAAGLTIKECGEQLQISPKTAEYHWARFQRKHLWSRTYESSLATLWAVAMGLIRVSFGRRKQNPLPIRSACGIEGHK